MERYICVHGHFYQPPRENPWLEAIELQDSAYPYHDWNERINVECYSPNATSRILNESGKIIKIINNYAHISFNVGPTLLSWMEEKAPDTYHAILEADKESQRLFSGHGSALAQAYNHMIMPLANERDKYTQIFWGIRDFEFRFGRFPEGMWLPEAAVDIDTLDILAGWGIKFTLLAPHQAKAIRPINGDAWLDVSGSKIDPTMPYVVHLPSGRKISVFFYDGPVSRAIAFERLLNKGEFLAERLLGAFSETRSHPQLVHVATDGETYGHHHRYGDMALAFALEHIGNNKLAHITNYGQFLEKFPPTFEVQIFENSSWSCVHGVERWRSDCGCNSGGKPGWHQEWRGPLRRALDWLRDTLTPRFDAKGREFFKDPGATRNDYIELILDRSEEKLTEFMDRHQSRTLNEADRVTALKLLEMERQMQLMYTSCGWFFDDLSGIETVQVIQYAGRAIQLATELFNESVESEFVERLSLAKSNIVSLQDGRIVFERFVKPTSMSIYKVGAHYAMCSLFQNGKEEAKTYCYDISYDDYRMFTAGKARLAVGRIRVRSEVTFESADLAFGVLHLGDHNLHGGVCGYPGDVPYTDIMESIQRTFSHADFTESIRLLDRYFGPEMYSLKSLFRDEQRHILSSILEATLGDAESMLRQVYENNAPLMRFLTDLWVPLPKALLASAEFVLNMNLRHVFQAAELDENRVKSLLAEAKEARVTLDSEGLAFTFQQTLSQMINELWSNPKNINLLANLEAAIGIVALLPFDVNLWSVQNNYYEILQQIYPEVKEAAAAGAEAAHAWVASLKSLGDKLKVEVL